MEGNLRVTPEVLINTANEFSSIGSTVANLTAEMTSTITGMSSFYQGDAATALIAKFNGLNDDIQRLCKMITEHSSDLNEMATVYSTTESQNVQIADSLQSDVIV